MEGSLIDCDPQRLVLGRLVEREEENSPNRKTRVSPATVLLAPSSQSHPRHMTLLRKLQVRIALCRRQMTISGSEPMMRQELGDVLIHAVHCHLQMPMSKILRGWEILVREVDTGGSSERLDDDDDRRTDLVDSLCRTPTSFTLRSYIRLGKTLSNIDRYLQSSKPVFPRLFSVVISSARPNLVSERRLSSS
jgi:hypothetical protein